MLLQNWWQGNQFQMPGWQPFQPQAMPAPAGLLAAGVAQPGQMTGPGGLLGYGGDGDNGAGDSTGAAPDGTGSVGIGIGPASGSPGTGGIAGLAGAVTGLAAPGIANVASQIGTGKSIGENVMNMMAEMGLSQNPTVGQQANNAAAAANAAGPGTGAVGGVAGVGANVGTNADPEASVSDPGGAGGSAGGGGGDGTVICTLLHELGYIPDAVYAADAEYGRNADPALIAGYHFWAVPYVRHCRNSGPIGRCALRVARAIAVPWAREMAYRAGVLSEGSRLGAFLFIYGVPACRALGRFLLAYRRRPRREYWIALDAATPWPSVAADNAAGASPSSINDGARQLMADLKAKSD